MRDPSDRNRVSVRLEQPSSGGALACSASRSNSRMHTATLHGERTVESPEKQRDQPRTRARTHQADAPDPAGERTKAGAYLDPEFLEEMLAHGGIVDAVRNA